MARTAKLDCAAIVASSLCLVHCLALPLMVTALPFVAIVAEAKWLHWLLAAFAVVAFASILAHAPDARRPRFLAPAITGLALILGALLADGVGIDERLPTAIGGALLAFAHLGRLLGHK